MFADPFWIALCGIFVAAYIIWYTCVLLQNKNARRRRKPPATNHNAPYISNYDWPHGHSSTSIAHGASVHPTGRLTPYKHDAMRESLKDKRPLKVATRSNQQITPPYHENPEKDIPVYIPQLLFVDNFDTTAKAADECIDGRMSSPRRSSGGGRGYPW